MRIKISILSVLTLISAGSAIADARLPVVNVAAGSVSARAAFGEKALNTEQPVANKATVVARAAKNQKSEIRNQKSVDVLVPMRPSDDLWAKNNEVRVAQRKPLPLPESATAFLSPREWNSLPEERITETVNVNGDNALDNEISRLVALQRKGAENIVAERKPSWIENNRVVARAVDKAEIINNKSETINEPVAVRRVVVPAAPEPVEYIARTAEKSPSADQKLASVNENEMAKMSPGELKKAFKKTYLSENKHLSSYQIDDRFDVASDPESASVGFDSSRDLSETGGVRPLEIKIGFRGDDSALSRDNYNLLSEYASIVVSNPKRAIQVSIPENATRSFDDRKLAARRLAIVEQVLRDTGVADSRIVPVLAQRNDSSFVLRVISSEQFETMTQSRKDMFGDTVGKKTYKSMSW